MKIIRINKGSKNSLSTLNEEHDELGSVDGKFVRSDLPHPNSAEEDGYGSGGVKKSATGASTTATRSRQ